MKAFDPTGTVSPRVLGIALFCLALLVRVVHLLHAASTPLLSYHRTFPDSDMYLIDQWAQRIAAGDVLGRETYHPIAEWQLRAAPLSEWNRWYEDVPVYYKAPFYAYLVGALRRVFGEPILPLALLQILASCWCALLVLRIGEHLFGPTAGFLAGLLHALYAPDIHYDLIMLRGPWISLVALGGTLQLIGLLRGPTLSRAFRTGLTLGAALVINEGFLTVPPLVLLVLAWRVPSKRRAAACSGTLLLGLALALSPVAIRNLLVGVQPLKLAATSSTVYAVFNSGSSNPYFFDANPAAFAPTLRAGEGRLFATALACLRSFPGPLEVFAFYLKKATGLAIPFENPDNANIYYAALDDPLLGLLPGYALVFPLSIVGLVLARRRAADLAPLAPFSLSLLLSVMVALPLSRYRTTLAVFLVPFAGLTLARAVVWVRERRVVPLALAAAGAAALALGAAAWQSRVVFRGRPAGVFLYRPPEFFIGADYYMARGHPARAIQEMLRLARLNPERSVRATALMRVAALQMASRREDAAREAVEAAVEADPDDPFLFLAIGDFHRDALRDAPGALAFYRRALALDPPDGLRTELRRRLDTPATR